MIARAGLLAAASAPMAYLFVLAMAAEWPVPDLWPRGWRFDRWARLAQSGLVDSLIRSALISSTVALASTGLGFVTSRQITRSRHRRLFTTVAYLPFALSPVVLGACLLFLYLRVGLSGTTLGVILAQLSVVYAFAVVLLMSAWNAEKEGLAEVAATLGATPTQIWLGVLLPAAWPLLRVCFFQTFLISWVQYGLTLVIGAGKVRTVPLRVFDFVFEADPGYAAVASLLLILPPVTLLLLERRVLDKAV